LSCTGSVDIVIAIRIVRSSNFILSFPTSSLRTKSVDVQLSSIVPNWCCS